MTKKAKDMYKCNFIQYVTYKSTC